MIKTEFPTNRAELKEQFGYLSFQCTFINTDVVVVRSRRTYKYVLVTYCCGKKTGFICEDETLQWEKAFEIFKEVPSNYNDLDQWEEQNEERLELLVPNTHNYVFIDDKVIREVVKGREKNNG